MVYTVSGYEVQNFPTYRSDHAPILFSVKNNVDMDHGGNGLNKNGS